MNNKSFPIASMVAGLAAGAIASKLFDLVWGRMTDAEVPDPEHREIQFARLAGALVLEGAIVRLVRGFVDHGSRRYWLHRTGEWPGEERPETR
jgi:hypothetical protein